MNEIYSRISIRGYLNGKPANQGCGSRKYEHEQSINGNRHKIQNNKF